ncbi:MAG: FAD-dependent oxidoreductase, partial [Planctomycetaceae bacterium]|nr:FAD-dependent oxidoreductase [Planctomycetaceae bacterium]
MPINRREFLGTAVSGSVLGSFGAWARGEEPKASPKSLGRELAADVVIIGGSLGGCAAALAALRNGLKVVMTEETDWIGGQLTSQCVPPDEHSRIETQGANQSYRELRNRIRDYYRRHYPLTDSARKNAHLDPGNGSVSRLCHEPRVALAVLHNWFAPYLSGGRLTLLTEHIPVDADVEGDQVRAVRVR